MDTRGRLLRTKMAEGAVAARASALSAGALVAEGIV
jgi:hypothetical protein